jgi:hypothetical protein
VAIYLASQRPLQGVILVSPYDSIRSIAQESFPFVPVSLLLKHPFDSLTRAPFLKIPMLAVIAEEDKTVLPTHSQRLIEAWGGKTFLKVIPHTGHNNIHTGNGYWESISEFLNFLSSE